MMTSIYMCSLIMVLGLSFVAMLAADKNFEISEQAAPSLFLGNIPLTAFSIKRSGPLAFNYFCIEWSLSPGYPVWRIYCFASTCSNNLLSALITMTLSPRQHGSNWFVFPANVNCNYRATLPRGTLSASTNTQCLSTVLALAEIVL